MTATTNAGFDAAAAGAVVGALYLVQMDFASGTLYYTNWPVDVTVGATTYTGLGNLGSVGQIKESEDGALCTDTGTVPPATSVAAADAPL